MKIIFFIVNIVCLYAIAVIELHWLPFIGYCHNAAFVNKVLLNISYSVLAASIFEFLFHTIPFYADRKKFRIIIKTLFDELNTTLFLMKQAVNPYSMALNDPSKEDYIQMGMQQDFYDEYFSNQTKLGYIEERKNKVKQLAFSLLEYHNYLTNKELSLIVSVLDSYFLKNSIMPINFNLPNIENTEVYDNQREILGSIFDLYNDVNSFLHPNK